MLSAGSGPDQLVLRHCVLNPVEEMGNSSVDVRVAGMSTARAEGHQTGKVPLAIRLAALEGSSRVALL